MAQRNIQGLWEIVQTNGFKVALDVGPINQQNGSFQATAFQEGNQVNGNGSGNVNGDFMHFTITWDNGTQGAYNGAFDAQGFINGASFDVKHPDSVAGWRSSKSF